MSFNSKLTEYLTEYSIQEKLYTDPQIYHGGKNYDLSKRWYVYYSFKHPETGKMTRQAPVYHNVNRDFKTKPERMKALNILKSALERMLKDGYSPYEQSVSTATEYTAKSALEFAMRLKAKEISERSVIDYTNRLDHFIKYLERQNLSVAPIQSIDRRVVIDFLNHIQLKSSSRNRNNTKTVLSALFSKLADNYLIKHNFILNINNLKTTPERHRTYSDKKVKDLFAYLDENEPVLFLFIKVFSYNFLRPVEACRIRVGDVDLVDRRIVFKAKNKPLKYKSIPEIVYQDLVKLHLDRHPDSHFLFTPSGPGKWDAKESSRRDYFTEKFLSVKKEFELGDDYSMYSFRHYFITKLYQHFRQSHSVTETLDKLQLVTGHESLDGLKNYLRTIDAEIPADWSDGLK